MLWDLISASTKNRAVVLTSHSMVETEALCNKIGIMVAGRLKCLGTPQHLRSLYGQGYQIDMNLLTEHDNAELSTQQRVEVVRQFVKRVWPSSAELECHDANIKFRIEKNQPINAPAHALAQSNELIDHSVIQQLMSQSSNESDDKHSLVSIGRMFHILERVRSVLQIREYSASEMTLEQIFLYFAQSDPNQKQSH
jgi:ATP-binding cassette subfamily A (ABC1) protein 5